MADVLIALGFLVLLGVGVTLVVRKSGTKVKDERDPEQPRNVDRGHARSEAEAARDEPLSPAEEEEAAELVAFLDEIGTGEFPVLAFDIDPLTAPIPDDRAVADPDLFDEVTAALLLSRFTWTLPAEPAVPFSSVQISEPAPLELDSFTTGWTRAEMDAILARGKAGASR